MEKKKNLFPKNFFKQPMKKATKSSKDDIIPFKWQKSVLEGRTKVKIVKCK